ncbi:MAG: hypothetical protein OXC29_13620 [Rhodococcus sp.]|nr:hypothetical protein [Rhodococcus sp. (in: high G+C Gram-positive bacteria)]
MTVTDDAPFLFEAISSGELQRRARESITDLLADASQAVPNSATHSILTAHQTQISLRCHRWTVANAPPAGTDPAVYDWTDRVVLPSVKFERNGFDQPIQGSGQVMLALTADDVADLEWGALVLHFWVSVTDLGTGRTAWFEFGSWVVAEQTRCTDLEAAPGLSDRRLYDVRLFDRVGWLDIRNAVRWDVSLAVGWSLDTEVRRILDQPGSPWGTVGGALPWGGASHDTAVRVDRAEPDFTDDNSLRYATGETTWLQIINDLSGVAIERGTLIYSDAAGGFVVPEWHGLRIGELPTPVWRLDADDAATVVIGTPSQRSRSLWNTPNHWVAIGTAAIAGTDTTARGNEIRNVTGEYGVARTGRTVSSVLRLETRDPTKLSNYARFVAYCDGQEALQVELEVKWLPFLWHNEHLMFASARTFGDRSPRRMVASEWTLTFDGSPQRLLLRQIPQISDYSQG